MIILSISAIIGTEGVGRDINRGKILHQCSIEKFEIEPKMFKEREE